MRMAHENGGKKNLIFEPKEIPLNALVNRDANTIPLLTFV